MDNITLEYSEKLKKRLKGHIKQIILFGSRARGDYVENSDYDFLLIVDKRNKYINDIIINESVELLNKYDCLIGTIIYEESEWDFKKRFPLGLNIQKEGVFL